MLTKTRIEELLDYASCYGDFNENTPDGTTHELGSPMNLQRRVAIITLKKVLGLLPEDYTNPLCG